MRSTQAIPPFLATLKEIPQAKANDEAPQLLEASYQQLKSQYELLVETKKALIDTLTEVREQTLSREAQFTQVGEEPIGNETYLQRLFSYLKDDLHEKNRTGQLTSDMVRHSPADLLIVFIKSVNRFKEEKYAKNVVELVEDVVDNLGGRVMIDEAFNTKTEKKHGVLKSKLAKQLQKDLSLFVAQMTPQINSVSTIKLRESMKQLKTKGDEEPTSMPGTIKPS